MKVNYKYHELYELAVKKKDTDLLKVLLMIIENERIMDSEAYRKKYEHRIFAAIKERNFQRVKILSNTFIGDIRNFKGETPTYVAMRHGFWEIADFLYYEVGIKDLKTFVVKPSDQ